MFLGENTAHSKVVTAEMIASLNKNKLSSESSDPHVEDIIDQSLAFRPDTDFTPMLDERAEFSHGASGIHVKCPEGKKTMLNSCAHIQSSNSEI